MPATMWDLALACTICRSMPKRPWLRVTVCPERDALHGPFLRRSMCCTTAARAECSRSAENEQLDRLRTRLNGAFDLFV